MASCNPSAVRIPTVKKSRMREFSATRNRSRAGGSGNSPWAEGRRRIFDEGAGLVHETWETFSRRLHFEVPGRTAYAILDARVRQIADWQRATRSEVPPFEATTRMLAQPALMLQLGTGASVPVRADPENPTDVMIELA